jgi:predicted transcriptional regulator
MLSSAIILSIHPEYSDKIFSGQKKVEFRKANIPLATRIVIVYSTSPASRIVGAVSISKVIEDNPDSLWNKFCKIGGMKKDAFFEYYMGTFRIENNDPIHRLASRPPQSFMYLPFDFTINKSRGLLTGTCPDVSGVRNI